MYKQNVLTTKAYVALLAVFAIFTLSLNAKTASDLFISEYGEGSSNNKYIEIYNGTGSSVDLSNYMVKNYYNPTSSYEINLSGTLSNGDVFVLAHSSASPAILAQADLTTGSANWDGNNAIGLYKNGNLIDVIGNIAEAGTDNWAVAGMPNATNDHTLIRKMFIGSPNHIWTFSAGDDVVDSEWIVKPIDYTEKLGMHDFALSETNRTAYLMVNTITPEVPIADMPFTVEVISTDINGVPIQVTEDALVELVQIKGEEPLQGNLQKTLKAGEYKVVFDNIMHPVKDEIIILPTAPNNDENDTDQLEAKNFEFMVAPKPVLVISTYEKGHVGSTHPTVRIEARNEDGTPNLYYSGYDVELMINNGMYSGTTMGQAMYGVVEFNNIVFEDAVNYELTAMSDHLVDSDPVTVDVKPTPVFEEIVTPEYITSGGYESGKLLPSYALVKFSNLHENTTYRFVTGALSTSDVFSVGEGGELTADMESSIEGNNFIYNADNNMYYNYAQPSLNTPDRFSSFTTNEETEKTFWVNLIAVNNNSFVFGSGNDVHWVVDLGFETGDLVVRRATNTTSENLSLGSMGGEYGSGSASEFYDDDAQLMPMNKVVFRDNLNNVVTTAMINDNGTMIQTPGFSQYAPYYYQYLEGMSGTFATFVPNSYSGIYRIEEYDNMGNQVNVWTDLDGEWATVSTVGDGDAIDFEVPRLMVYDLNDIVCSGAEPTMLAWNSHGVEEVNVMISSNGGGYELILEDIPARDGYYAWEIIREIYSTSEIVERQIKLMIESSEHNYINDETNEFMIYDAPMIFDQTQDAVICYDNTGDENDWVTLGVVATGSFLTYQWYKDGKMIENANNATLAISDAKYRESANYTVELKSGEAECASVWSEEIPVYVALDSEISNQPEDRGATLGGFASFRVKAHVNGVDPNYEIGVQWYKVASPVDIPVQDDAHIEGAQSSLLTFIDIQPDHFGEYYAVVEGKCDYPDVNSEIAELVEVAIDITGPEGVDACAGDEITLSVTAEVPGDETLAYQWQKDGADLMDDARTTGANAATLVITDVNPSDAGEYNCVVTAVESNVSSESDMATVTVGVAPEITEQSESQTIEPGSDLTLAITASGDDLTYTWTKDGDEVQTGSEAAFEITEATPEDAGDYICTISNDCGEAISETITVTVNDRGISSVSETSKNGFTLGTSVPSPVQSSATVQYSVPSAAQVTIVLRDMRGSQIAVLVDQFVAQGTHEFTLNADQLELGSGTYYYTLQSGSVTLSNSLMILK